MEYERGAKDEAKLFSLNPQKDRIAVELGKTGFNRLRGKIRNSFLDVTLRCPLGTYME